MRRRCSSSAPRRTTATESTTTRTGPATPRATTTSSCRVHCRRRFFRAALTDWIGGDGRLVAFSVQNRAIAYPGQQLTFGGVITGKRADGLVDLDIYCKRGDEVLMPGTATVALPSKVVS